MSAPGRSRPSCRNSGSASVSPRSRATCRDPKRIRVPTNGGSPSCETIGPQSPEWTSLIVLTVRVQLLYIWFAIDHGRRRILHFNVTPNPIAPWVIQQLRQAFPDEPTHRFLIFDNDAIFSAEVARSRVLIRPRRTALGSPWQNGTAERFVGTVRRELLDHVVVMSEDHPRRLLREYISKSTVGAF